jgi:hypothetical protein
MVILCVSVLTNYFASHSACIQVTDTQQKRKNKTTGGLKECYSITNVLILFTLTAGKARWYINSWPYWKPFTVFENKNVNSRLRRRWQASFKCPHIQWFVLTVVYLTTITPDNWKLTVPDFLHQLFEPHFIICTCG